MHARHDAVGHEAGPGEQRADAPLTFDTWTDDGDQRRELCRRLAPAGRSGSAWFIGTSGAGKSSLAAGLAVELAGRTCDPLLVVDSEDSLDEAFPNLPVAESVSDAIRLVWGEGRHCRWILEEPAELERVARAARELRRAVLYIDESSYYLHSGTSRKSELLKLIRTHRHRQVWLLFTTQHFSGDVPQAAFGGGPVLYIFQTSTPVALERLKREWRVPPELVESLPAGRCAVVYSGLSGRIVGA